MMRTHIPYAGDHIADINLYDYVSYLIEHDTLDLHKRNMDAWERWFHAMEQE